MKDGRDIVLKLDLYFDHDWDKTYAAISKKDISMFDISNIDTLLDTKLFGIIAEGYKILVMLDDEYPKEITRQTLKPPFVIYYKGDLETVKDRYIAKTKGGVVLCEDRMFLEE